MPSTRTASGVLIFDRFPTLERAQAFAQAVSFAEPELDVHVTMDAAGANQRAVYLWRLHAPVVLVERIDSGYDSDIERAREAGYANDTPTGAEREAGLEKLVAIFGGTFVGT